MAVQVALGSGGSADQGGALTAIAAEPAGRVLLWVLVVGFAAVVLWRAVSAVWGFGYVGDRARALAKRAVSAGLAVVYAVLAVAAATTALNGRSSPGGGGQATAGLLGLPGGQVSTALVGLGVLVGGGVMGAARAGLRGVRARRGGGRDRLLRRVLLRRRPLPPGDLTPAATRARPG